MPTISIERPSRPLTEVPDGELVREHLEGRDEAFAVLYRRYNDRLIGWFVRRTGDRVLSEDLAQDTMVRVLKYEDSFDQDRPMWPWLKTTAYRVMVNHLEDSPDDDESFEDQYEDEGEPDPLLASVEERPALERVLGQLSERHQTALSLRYVRGWSPDDVAEFFGMTRNACNQLMYRARNAARREYDRVCGEVRALVWPFLVPFASRWRSVLDRFRQSRWTSNSPQLANILPSLENAMQAVVATAVAMFVVATVSVGQVGGPDDAGGDTVTGAVPGDFAWDTSSGDRSETLSGDATTRDASSPSAPTAEVPEREGGTRRTLAVSSGDTSREAGSDAEVSLVTETERTADEDEDRRTVTSRLAAKIGREEADRNTQLNLHCDHSWASEAACDGIDDLP